MDASCAYQCPEGQTATHDKITCTKVVRGEENEVEVRLEPAVPGCRAITCEERCAKGSDCEMQDTNSVVSGSIKCDGNGYGALCHYECLEGFNLMGVDISGCGASGWNSTQPQCVPANCPERSAPRYGSLKCRNRGRVRCEYECDDGYTLYPPKSESSPTIKCKGNGEWDNDITPECRPVQCPEMPEELNGIFSCSHGEDFGSICSLICNSGHKVAGSDERLFYLSCGVNESLEPRWKLSDGTVIVEPPVCEPQQCQDVFDSSVERGGTVQCSNGLFFNSICDIECAAGQRKIGETKLVCEVHNDVMSWSGKLAKCEPIQCLDAIELSDGTFECQGVDWAGNELS